MFVVGATRFEHATSWSQTKRSTRLSYTPNNVYIYTILFYFASIFLDIIFVFFGPYISGISKAEYSVFADYYMVI